MDFKQIEAFVNVVKYKSFSKAADATFVTQPTISAHISSLEKELGTSLIDRKGKESRPTKQGRMFYKYALDMMNTRSKAFIDLQQYKEELSDVLEIQASSIPGQFLVPELVSEFHQLHEKVKFYVEQSDSKETINNILEQKGEIGFIGYAKTAGLDYELLYTDKCKIITPKTEPYLERHQKSSVFKISDMKNEAFIWREEGSATRTLFEDIYAKTVGNKINVIATVNSIDAIKQCVGFGLGISILSELAISESEAYLVFDLEDDAFSREFYMINKKNVALSPTAMEFKHFVLDYYRK
ncbi:DNA-binding transcriptional LysR family regulator [Clostridiales Family XIII bacterium PM5-7]